MRPFNRILIDGDILVYAQAHVLEGKGEGERQPLLSGIYGMRATVRGLKERFSRTDVTTPKMSVCSVVTVSVAT